MQFMAQTLQHLQHVKLLISSKMMTSALAARFWLLELGVR
jgi:hypothetical protein